MKCKKHIILYFKLYSCLLKSITFNRFCNYNFKHPYVFRRFIFFVFFGLSALSLDDSYIVYDGYKHIP